MTKRIYYLPGAGGLLHTGLGSGLIKRGYEPRGRETVGDFRRLRFGEQVDLIARDLQQNFWDPTARVIANSFGGYLFLHALAQMPAFPGKALVLSPIVGEFSNEETMNFFSPPCAGKLQKVIAEGRYPRPENCEIHVGELDWQSIPSNVLSFAQPLNIPVTIVPGRGHMLGEDYVSPLLDRWLA